MQNLETEKLMDELYLAYHRRDLFLERVRTAYRELVLTLPENSVDTCRMMCQDSLSLYSPWMNAKFMILEEFTNRFNAELERILGSRHSKTARRFGDIPMPLQNRISSIKHFLTKTETKIPKNALA